MAHRSAVHVPLYWLLSTSVQEIGLFQTLKPPFKPQLYWLIDISVGQRRTSPPVLATWNIRSKTSM